MQLMKGLMHIFTINLYLIVPNEAQDVQKTDYCRDHAESFRRIGPIHSFASVRRGHDVRLPCVSSCPEGSKREVQRIWYKKKLNNEEVKVELDLHSDTEKNKIFEDPDHTLNIKNIDDKDIATYFCREILPSMKTYPEPGVYYFVDIEDEVKGLEAKEGGEEELSKFSEEMNHINDKKLRPLHDKEASKWRVFTSWGPWGPCSECEKKGTRRRVGNCRVRKMPDWKHQEQSKTNDEQSAKQAEREVNAGLSCYSRRLTELPTLLNLVRDIQPFVYIESCNVSCLGLYAELASWERSKIQPIVPPFVDINEPIKDKDIKMMTTSKTVTEGKNIFLVCYGAELNLQVFWMNGTRVIRPGPDKHIRIDAYGKLHVQNVQQNDATVYTCWVNGVVTTSINLLVTLQPGVRETISYFLQLLLGIFMSFLIFLSLLFIMHKQRLKQPAVKASTPPNPGIYRRFLIPKLLKKPKKKKADIEEVQPLVE